MSADPYVIVRYDGQLSMNQPGALQFGLATVCACGSRSPQGAVVDKRWRCADCLYFDSRSITVEPGDRFPFGRGRRRYGAT